jgi:hypothetical protein
MKRWNIVISLKAHKQNKASRFCEAFAMLFAFAQWPGQV